MCRYDQPTNHDAAPAAIARTDADSDRADKAVLRPGEGTGDTPVTEPAAWGVMRVGGSWVSILNSEVQAETSRKSFDQMENWVHEVVPLYRRPQTTLTDAERSLLTMLVDHPRTHALMYDEEATLRGQLERLAQKPPQ